MNHISIMLFQAGDHYAPVVDLYPPLVVLHCRSYGITYGENGLFHGDGEITVHAIEGPNGVYKDFKPFTYDYRYFSGRQRRASEAAAAQLQPLLEHHLDSTTSLS